MNRRNLLNQNRPARPFILAAATLLLVALAGEVRAQGPRYQASSGFSSAQGQGHWYYQYWNGSSYADMTWDGSKWVCPEGGLFVGSNWFHPGPASDAVRKWVAPRAGSVRVSGQVRRGDAGGGDGVNAKVVFNGAAVFDQDVDYNNTTGFAVNVTLTVAAGDAVYFRVNRRGSWDYDTTEWDAVVEYTDSAGSQWISSGSDIYYDAGRVGIGTASPAAKLQVAGGSAFISGDSGGLAAGAGAGLALKYTSGTAQVFGYDYSNSTPKNLILQSPGGNVGVGTSGPSYKLDVAGSVNGTGLCIAGDCKSAWSQVGGQWATSGSSINYGGGNVGIGISSPDLTGWGSSRRVLTIRGPAERAVVELSNPSTGAAGVASSIVGMNAATRLAQIDIAADGATDSGKMQFFTWNAGSVAERMRIDKYGNVGIGMSNPALPLEIGSGSGNQIVRLNGGPTQSTGLIFQQAGTEVGRITFANSTDLTFGMGPGNTEKMRLTGGGNLNVSGTITGGSIEAKYQDVAEWVPSSQKLQAGTVVVLDAGRTNHVVASTKCYDTAVAGVVSAEPGVILGVGGEGKVKVATTGRVRMKVDATRAPVRVGDLLVTSDIEGVAMKSAPVELGGVQIHRPGTIIGKALEPLEGGTGEILVLLSLQ